MKNLKRILIKSPEYYLIVLVLLSGYSPPFSFNPVLIGIAAVIMLQIVFKNKISGFIIAGLFLLVNLYMTGALIAEISEFQPLNTDAKKMLFGGAFLLGINFLMSLIMIFKYTEFALPREYPVKSG